MRRVKGDERDRLIRHRGPQTPGCRQRRRALRRWWEAAAASAELKRHPARPVLRLPTLPPVAPHHSPLSAPPLAATASRLSPKCASRAAAKNAERDAFSDRRCLVDEAECVLKPGRTPPIPLPRAPPAVWSSSPPPRQAKESRPPRSLSMDHGRPHTLTGRRAPHDSDGAIPLTLLIDLGGVCGGSSAGDAPLRSAVTTAHAYVSPRSPPPSRRLLSSGGAVGPPPLGGAAGACMWLFRTSRLGGERNQPRGGPAPGQSHLWIPRGKKQLFHPPLHGAPASYGQHATTETGRGAGGALPPQRTKMSSTANNIMEGGSLAQPKHAAASVGESRSG